MKHFSLMLGLLIALGLASCKKDDFPPSSELWQLSNVHRMNIQYKYDDHRRLTHITKLPWGFGPNFLFTTDQLGRLLTLRDSGSVNFDNFVYQHGKLVRIDGGATQQTVFTYDAQGRIIRKEGNANYYDYVVYEYAGNSRNFKRASFFTNTTTTSTNGESTADVIMEYIYDNKISPYSTVANAKVIPFFFSEYMGPTFYDPVVPNNVVNQKFFGKVDTGYFKFMEHNYTYVYENNLPVSFAFQRIHYNSDGTPGFQTTEAGGYSYDKFHW